MRSISGTWRRAQEQEGLVWRGRGCADEGYLARRGARLDAWLRFWGAGGRRVLEVGGAGLPCVQFLTGFAERHAVDPLMDEYRIAFGAVGQKARSEDLPYPDGHFDAVVMLNVLDHCDEPDQSLAEIARVLRPGTGHLLFSCDVYGWTWLHLRRVRMLLRGKRRNDILHPHHFTKQSLLGRLAARFRLCEVGVQQADPLTGETPRGLTPGALGRLKGEGRLYVVAERA